jgi:hypothetical protein
MLRYTKKTPERLELLRQLWPDTNNSVPEIARRLDVSVASVANWAKELGLTRGMTEQGKRVQAGLARARERRAAAGLPVRLTEQRPAPPPVPQQSYMSAEAARRGLSVTELERKILSVVAKDRMVNAVLDDVAA